jgi:hypothetical protein
LDGVGLTGPRLPVRVGSHRVSPVSRRGGGRRLGAPGDGRSGGQTAPHFADRGRALQVGGHVAQEYGIRRRVGERGVEHALLGGEGIVGSVGDGDIVRGVSANGRQWNGENHRQCGEAIDSVHR